MNRRDFLLASGAAAVGLGEAIHEPAAYAEETTPRIKKYNPLGKTGLKISDISFGGGKLNTPSLVARAVDMGVTAADFAWSCFLIIERLSKQCQHLYRRSAVFYPTIPEFISILTLS